MDARTVFRVISLIPDRMAWAPSGTVYNAEGKSERVALLAKLTHWLSPLDALTLENQQFLGLRHSGARPADADAEGDLEAEADEAELSEESPVRYPEAGTQIAA
jgi:hypothetical protein